MSIKPCAYCQQRPSLSADTINPNPSGQGVGLGTCWTLACECGRGSSSLISYEDAVERWNAQADDRELAASSARFKREWEKP